MSSIKKKRLIKGSQMGVVGEDRISKLPDTLLLHILSFLPTKRVVTTSILSKRWRYVWTFIPVIDFREWRLTTTTTTTNQYSLETANRLETAKIMSYVDRMLCFHDGTLTIKKLYLYCDHNFDISKVNTWISTVITRKVEELYLSLTDWHPLPPCIFTCESLTSLELKLHTCLELPESISFPRLKILRLTYMSFKDKTIPQQLISNCPILEELTFTGCDWEGVNVVSISAPALKCLSFDGLDNLHLRRINIYAPCLLSLKYVERVPERDFSLPNSPSLVDADIDFRFVRSSAGTAYAATKFIGELYNVKFLRLSGAVFKALSFAEEPLITLPTFYNLIHLEVSSKFPPLINKTLLDFLKISPYLESLCFAQGLHNGNDGWGLDLAPGCLLLHLKSVEFRDFYGHSRELNAVKLFLKNAPILHRMTIKLSSTLSTDLKNKLMEQLQMFSRGSTSCVIKVS